MKRSFLPLFAAGLSLAVLLSGCGASSGNASQATAGAAAYQEMPAATETAVDYSAGFYDAAAPAAENYDMDFGSDAAAGETAAPSGEGVAQQAADTQRKIIRHANMTLETKAFDEALREIESLVTGSGGYIESQSIDGQSLSYRGDYYERSASIMARIPAEKLDEVASQVGTLCNVVSRSESMDDISDTYFDAQARLETLNIQEERLLAILEKAESLEDVITLESALSDVRYEIESITASLRRMDSQVTYSYLNMDLREVLEYQKISDQPPAFSTRLSNAFAEGIDSIVVSLENTLLICASAGPVLVVWLVILGLLVCAILLIVRRVQRRAEQRRAARNASVQNARADQPPAVNIPPKEPEDKVK